MNAVDYTVIRNFTDKTNNQSYKIGESYNAQDPQRVQELEGAGYIAATSSQFAADAKAQAKNAQANAQKMAQTYSQIANNAEEKTVLNGKVVPLKVAQAAEAAFEETNTQSGVQAHHANASEAVPAGQIASQSQSTAEAGAAQTYNAAGQAQQQGQVKQANVQSGQAHLEQHMQEAQQQMQQMQQQQQQQMQGQSNMQGQQAQQAAAKAAEQAALKTGNAAAAEHETAAEMQQAATKAQAKATKKGQ